MLLRNGGLLITACLATASFAGNVGVYPLNKVIDRVEVGTVTVDTSDGINLDAAVTLPPCPGLSRLAGYLTFTWQSSTGESISRTVRFSNGSEATDTHLGFQESGSFGSAVGGSVAVDGSASCTGD